MKKLSSLFFLIASIFIFSSCSKSIVYDNKVVFPDDNWAFEQKAVTFEAPLKGSEKPFSVILDLELIGKPNVETFYAWITLISPAGGKTIKSVVFNLVNPNEPFIRGDTPNKKYLRLTVYPKKYFSETGTYTFEVNQFSHKADNYGIRSLRLYIEQIQEK
jgi:hypothetical protein